MWEPLVSGHTWEDDPVGGGVNEPSGTSDIRFVRAVGRRDVRAVAKSARNPARVYSLGMERVAYRLAVSLGLPVPATHLETVAGVLSSLQMLIVGRSYITVRSVPMMRDVVSNRDCWALAALFDVWMANTDRNAGNVLFEPIPPGARPPAATGSRCWLIDHGQAGLWPGWKLDPTRDPDNIVDDAGDITSGVCCDAAERRIKDVMASPLRNALNAASLAERGVLLDRLRAIEDDAIDDAINEVPRDYFSIGQADALQAFLKVRRDAADTVLGNYW